MLSSHPERADLTQADIDWRLFDLFDEYCHWWLDRRGFLDRAAALGLLAGALTLPPGHARAEGPHEAHSYVGTQHRFHNNSMPRYQEAAAS